ncbi:MAG: shikimate dehydrogenase [Synergistaceae bacterium]|jgi:shikimate dehydrogenase|nr:shikimate dehydrogenase [Synergistaceae bacterium]
MRKPKTYWADTDFYGLLGNPIRESLSPAMHNANFEALGMNALYTPFEVEVGGMPKILSALEALRFKGLNVTMPLKRKIIPYLDEMDEIGGLCDAVNTLYWKNGKLCGTNTDGFGFVHALKEQGRYDPTGKRCLIFGAGGAARGVAFALCAAGISSITLWGRASGVERISKLASDLNAYRNGVCEACADPAEVGRLLKENELVINSTSVGMMPDIDATPFDTSLLESKNFVCDVVYVPRDTKLLREAEAKGCGTLAGHWMMIWQGVEAFRRWTGGKEPDVKVMTQTVLEHLTRVS